ncbi:hypothetical protein P43SY_001249 [Pythium insidiosum]|uniref:TFIID subunit TAF5 NTD2 domain-containing protein n=1 Tax=Pythium insidiosum TaxID=114742 RepID=A0AAD5LC21_PYTIN|nr:hypothetical protein P43SY_001249 [Pythium insidiosum]
MNMAPMPTAAAPSALPSAMATPSPSAAASAAAAPVGLAASTQTQDAMAMLQLQATRPHDASPAPLRRRTVENVMDELMLQYLRKKGYHIQPQAPKTEPSPGGDVEMADAPPALANGVADGSAAVKREPALSEEDKQRYLGIDPTCDDPSASASADAEADTVSLERYARQLGLSTESCAANHILFFGLTRGDPSTYADAYARLMDWICNSLDMYKYELHAVAFPVFVHCFLDLMAKGLAADGKAFFHRFARDHMRLHVEELRQLSLIFRPEHLRTNEYAQQVLRCKFNVQLSLLSFELLNAFLSHEQLFLLLAIVNERVNLVVSANQPGMQIQLLDDTDTKPLPNLTRRRGSGSRSRGDDDDDDDDEQQDDDVMGSPDDVAQAVAMTDQPSDSEIAVPLTSGEYDLEYMVKLAGGQGATLDDLHAIKINWGVLPPRKLLHDDDAAAAVGNGKASDHDGSSGGASGGAASATGADGSTAGGAAGGVGDSDKKGSGAGASGSSGSAGAGDGAGGDGSAAGSTTTKADSKSKSGDKASSSSAAAAAASDAQRKAKRARLATETELDRRKSELDVTGPLPDRKNAFNAQLLERLVLRQPAEMKAQAMEDARTRASLSRRALPSALCFSLVNAESHVTDMCFSDDATMVGACCDDGAFRVWRNDEQPLGTARGSVYQGGDLPDEDDEDETTAVLRGHSSAVYGASFSPDNQFALTASGDSTVRLWSLAAKSNVVIYRSHEGFPVWDVRFGPHGYYFASCSMDRTARLWSTDRLTPLRVLAGHLADVDCVEFHPNHNYMATGSSDKTVRLWDVQSGKCLRIFTGHFHGVQALAFSRNGRYLASSGDDNYINVWDLQAGKRLETLIGHKAPVTSLQFSQESAILASSGLDATVRLWDMAAAVDQPATSSQGSASGGAHALASSSSVLKASAASSSSAYVRPMRMVRPSAMQQLPTSRFLLKTLRAKQTPIYRVHFTPRNLLLTGGVFQPKSE